MEILLKMEWDELKLICYALDNNYDILDPHNFTDCKFVYVQHLKTCYYLDHNE